MTIVNYQREKVMVFDGIESDFIKLGGEIECPCCEGFINFGLYNSLDFDKLNDDTKIRLASKIRGVKLTGTEIKEYKCKGSPIRIYESKCSKCLHDITVVFTYQEIQPSRYESYLIGYFYSNDI